jgi:hypothetical protein
VNEKIQPPWLLDGGSAWHSNRGWCELASGTISGIYINIQEEITLQLHG